MKISKFLWLPLALMLSFVPQQQAFAANNCIQLLRGVQNRVHQDALDCVTQTGQSFQDCKQTPWIVEELEDGVGDYVNCMNWAPTEGYTLNISGGITATCIYEDVSPNHNGTLFTCTIAKVEANPLLLPWQTEGIPQNPQRNPALDCYLRKTLPRVGAQYSA